MNANARVLKIFNESGAVITDSHVVYQAGEHGSVYINKDAIYVDSRKTSGLCWELAQLLPPVVDAVVAPATGGVALSQWVGYHLTSMGSHDVLSLYADKGPDGSLALNRGYGPRVRGKRVYVIEDVLNSGSSAKKVVEAVRRNEGEVVGVGALCNRGGVTAEMLGVPKLVALLTVTLDKFPAHVCPLCLAGVPINIEVGHGREFLAAKGS